MYVIYIYIFWIRKIKQLEPSFVKYARFRYFYFIHFHQIEETLVLLYQFYFYLNRNSNIIHCCIYSIERKHYKIASILFNSILYTNTNTLHTLYKYILNEKHGLNYHYFSRQKCSFAKKNPCSNGHTFPFHII